jgi:hypothetical protein
MNDIVAGKVRNLRDCLLRLRQVDPGDLAGIVADPLRQDSPVLNVQRACQTAIDLATHLVQTAPARPSERQSRCVPPARGRRTVAAGTQ